MPLRRPLYDIHQGSAKASKPQPSAPRPGAAPEPPPSGFHITPAWIDTAGRTRTWALKDPHGTQMAEITTKSAALKLAALLTRVMDDERGPAR